MKLNTMTKTLVCGFSVMFLLSLGACQIKSAGVRVETDTELKAKVSRAIKRYMQENGDAPRSFDLLKGKYLDEKTYELALESNMKYTYVGNKSYRFSMPSKPKSGPSANAPAHVYSTKHRYRYYPSCYVYFDVSRKCYFYLSRDGWKVSASLPVHMRAQLGDYVSIEMDTDRPYSKFQEHKKKYPPRQLKMKKKKRWL